jgi:siderophore synthetase component
MFKFGNQKPTIFKYAIVGVVLTSIIAGLSNCTGIHENKLWDLLDEIQRKYFPQTILNEFILKDPEKLNRRIIRDVDKAIENVTLEYDRIIREADQKYKPKYLEKSVDDSVCYTEECKKLGGEMRICAPWAKNCTSDIYK